MQNIYTKLTARCGGGDDDVTEDFFENLSDLIHTCYEMGSCGFVAIQSVELITEEEYKIGARKI